MTDPILEPYDYYYYDIRYYDDYVSDEEEEECDTCEDCGGSGYDDCRLSVNVMVKENKD